LTIDVVARGISLISKKEFKINSKMRHNIMQGDRENDAGNIDAYDASAIIQAGLFGDLIYG
jgi:hypothetical protein